MKPALIALLMTAMVAACGVDGPPESPAQAPAQADGVQISGDARIGVDAKL